LKKIGIIYLINIGFLLIPILLKFYIMELVLIIVVILLYFIPSFVAWKKQCSTGVIILNIFLGWTFIGWVVALIWAVTGQK